MDESYERDLNKKSETERRIKHVIPFVGWKNDVTLRNTFYPYPV